jgi:3-oxoacyl-[acyl-carrier-protein] synthase III
MFRALGLAQYASSASSTRELAVEAARSSLRAAFAPAIGAFVYATNTLAASNESRDDLRQFSLDLGISSAIPVGVFAWECANLHLAMRTSADLIATGRTSSVLVATADRCLPGETRILPPNLTVLSDSAASAILSTEPGPSPCFAIVGAGEHSDPSLWKLDVERELQEFYRGTVDGIKAAVAGALASSRMSIGDVSSVITNNYNLSIMRTFAAQIGFDAKRAWTKNLARFGHAYAADNIINLADMVSAGEVPPGAHVLLVSSGPTTWGATLLRRVDGMTR